MAKTHFFSVGNPLFGDDGVGLAVLKELEVQSEFVEDVFFDAHTDALAMIDRFEPEGKNIIIDAAKMGKQPGHVEIMQRQDVRMKIQWDHLSIHGFGLAGTLDMAEKIGVLPKELWVVGIEPEQIKIDTELSPGIKVSISDVVEKIKKEVFGYET